MKLIHLRISGTSSTMYTMKHIEVRLCTSVVYTVSINVCFEKGVFAFLNDLHLD